MAVHELFAYLHVKQAGPAIAFYQTVFGATEKFRLPSLTGVWAMRSWISTAAP